MKDTPITDAATFSVQGPDSAAGWAGDMIKVTHASDMQALERAANAMEEALEYLLTLRKNCEGDIGWRGVPEAIVDDIRVKHILAIEKALAQYRALKP